ncbi:MAG: pantoate--beta-alanine ligase [Crocinitomicaceae bacterium]|nr:pantoate--beta-alanine ligase [Crocinitomicaceae bacterium]
MQVFSTAAQLMGFIANLRKVNPDFILGFVPTMGALHEGHMSLIKEAKRKADLVVCSVFVNPTQFNDAKDLEKYPRTLEADLKLLEENGCDFVYTPQVEDIYPNGLDEPYEINFAGLDEVMEGKFRPGHFKGVAQVVERFFRIVNPDKAFFGRKDFQQTAIIKHLVKVKSLPIEICIVETSRSKDGLALSSRNTRLSDEQLKEALIIYKTLINAKELIKTAPTVAILKEKLISFFNQGNLKLEYLEIVDDDTLQPINNTQSSCTCCIAAFCGPVRLIDNMSLKA